MTYFPDLSEFTYWPDMGRHPAYLAVGWLDESHPFPVGEISPDLVEKLRSACADPQRLSLGYHGCEFCRPPQHLVPAMCGGREIYLGNAEIRVEGRGETIYFAPNLILHYVTAHRYLPPAEFLEALDAEA